MFTPERNAILRNTPYGSGSPTGSSPVNQQYSSFSSTPFSQSQRQFSSPSRDTPLSINELRSPGNSFQQASIDQSRPRYQLANVQSDYFPGPGLSDSNDPHPIISTTNSGQQNAYLPSFLMNAAQGRGTPMREQSPGHVPWGGHQRQSSSPPSRFGGPGFATNALQGKRRLSQMDMDEAPPSFTRVEIEAAESAAAEQALYAKFNQDPSMAAAQRRQQEQQVFAQAQNAEQYRRDQIMRLAPSRPESGSFQRTSPPSHRRPQLNPHASPADRSSSLAAHSQPSSIMIFGHPTTKDARDFVEKRFRNLAARDDDIRHVAINDAENTISITYANSWEAVKAIKKNGEQWIAPNGSKFFVGVKALNPEVEDMANGGTATVGMYGRLLPVEKGGKASPRSKQPAAQNAKSDRNVSRFSMSASHSPLARQLTGQVAQKRMEQDVVATSSASSSSEANGQTSANGGSSLATTAKNTAYHYLNSTLNMVFGW